MSYARFTSSTGFASVVALLVATLTALALATPLAAQQTAGGTAKPHKNQPEAYRLYDALTVLFDNPSGQAFELDLEVRDINHAPRGPAELLVKLYTPDGKVVVREMIPDDGITKGSFTGPVAGYDHTAWYYAIAYSRGIEPAVRFSAWTNPARVAQMPSRKFTYKIPAAGPGTCRMILVGQPDLIVSFSTSTNLKFGVSGSPDYLLASNQTYRSGYVYIPKGTRGVEAAVMEMDQPYGRKIKIFDPEGKQLLEVGGYGSYAKSTLRFITEPTESPAAPAQPGAAAKPAPPAPPKPANTTEVPTLEGQVLRVEVDGSDTDCLFSVHLMTPTGNRYGRPGGRMFALICPDPQTALALKNGAIEHDGQLFYQPYAITLYDYLKTLKPEDFVSPPNLPANPKEFTRIGSHERTPKESADILMHEYLYTKDRATLNRALKDMLMGMRQIGHDDHVMRGFNLAYEMGGYSYFYPRPAWRILSDSDAPEPIKNAIHDYTIQIGDRLAFARGIELINGNALASLIVNLKYCLQATNDPFLRDRFEDYFSRFTNRGFNDRVGVGPSGGIQEGFGYDLHYGSYPFRGWKSIQEDSGDPRFKKVMDRMTNLYSYIYNEETKGGAWSSRTSERPPADAYRPAGPVPFKGHPGPSFTTSVNDANEFFAAKRPDYYAVTYHGRITPAYLGEGVGGQIGYGGGMLAQLHIPGKGPVIVSRLHGSYGVGMHPALWKNFLIHSVVGQTLDGLPLVSAHSEHPDAALTNNTVNSNGEVKMSSVRINRTYTFEEDGIVCSLALGSSNADRVFKLWGPENMQRGRVSEAYELIPLIGFKPGKQKSANAKDGRLELAALDSQGKPIGNVQDDKPLLASTVVLDRGGYGVRVELPEPRMVHRGAEGSLFIKLAEPGTEARDIKLTYKLVPFGGVKAEAAGATKTE